MVPEWKIDGISFISQIGAVNPMDKKQSLSLEMETSKMSSHTLAVYFLLRLLAEVG